MLFFLCFAPRNTDAERHAEEETADKHRRLSSAVRHIFDALDFGLCGGLLWWDPMEYDPNVGMKENARRAKRVLGQRFEL